MSADPYDLDAEDEHLKGSFQDWARVVKVTGQSSKYNPVVKTYPAKKKTGTFLERMSNRCSKRLEYTPAFWKRRKKIKDKESSRVASADESNAVKDEESIQDISSASEEDDIPDRYSLNLNLSKINYQPGRKRKCSQRTPTPAKSKKQKLQREKKGLHVKFITRSPVMKNLVLNSKKKKSNKLLEDLNTPSQMIESVDSQPSSGKGDYNMNQASEDKSGDKVASVRREKTSKTPTNKSKTFFKTKANTTPIDTRGKSNTKELRKKQFIPHRTVKSEESDSGVKTDPILEDSLIIKTNAKATPIQTRRILSSKKVHNKQSSPAQRSIMSGESDSGLKIDRIIDEWVEDDDGGEKDSRAFGGEGTVSHPAISNEAESNVLSGNLSLHSNSKDKSDTAVDNSPLLALRDSLNSSHSEEDMFLGKSPVLPGLPAYSTPKKRKSSDPKPFNSPVLERNCNSQPNNVRTLDTSLASAQFRNDKTPFNSPVLQTRAHSRSKVEETPGKSPEGGPVNSPSPCPSGINNPKRSPVLIQNSQSEDDITPGNSPVLASGGPVNSPSPVSSAVNNSRSPLDDLVLVYNSEDDITPGNSPVLARGVLTDSQTRVQTRSFRYKDKDGKSGRGRDWSSCIPRQFEDGDQADFDSEVESLDEHDSMPDKTESKLEVSTNADGDDFYDEDLRKATEEIVKESSDLDCIRQLCFEVDTNEQDKLEVDNIDDFLDQPESERPKGKSVSPAIDNLTGTLMEEITKHAEETSSSGAPNGNDHEMDDVDFNVDVQNLKKDEKVVDEEEGAGEGTVSSNERFSGTEGCELNSSLEDIQVTSVINKPAACILEEGSRDMFFTSFDSEDEEETAENNTVDSAAVNDPTLSQDMFRMTSDDEDSDHSDQLADLFDK